MKIAILVSGGGTNLQAIIDKVNSGSIRNTSIEVVISNKKDAYALTRAKEHGIASECLSPKDYEKREDFNQALVDLIDSYHVDLIVLAGYLVILPEILVKKYENRNTKSLRGFSDCRRRSNLKNRKRNDDTARH